MLTYRHVTCVDFIDHHSRASWMMTSCRTYVTNDDIRCIIRLRRRPTPILDFWSLSEISIKASFYGPSSMNPGESDRRSILRQHSSTMNHQGDAFYGGECRWFPEITENSLDFMIFGTRPEKSEKSDENFRKFRKNRRKSAKNRQNRRKSANFGIFAGNPLQSPRIALWVE